MLTKARYGSILLSASVYTLLLRSGSAVCWVFTGSSLGNDEEGGIQIRSR